MKSTTKLLTKPFDIYVPATENREARKVATIEVQVHTDENGDEVLTPDSLDLIDKTQARYMGLLMGEDIRALRERLNLSQDELSDRLGCGKKSLSRWENGHGYPSQLVNTLLRALDENLLTPAQLRGLQEPRADWAYKLYAETNLSTFSQVRFVHSHMDLHDSSPYSPKLEGHASAMSERWHGFLQTTGESSPSFKSKPVAIDDWANCPAVNRGQMNQLCLVGS